MNDVSRNPILIAIDQQAETSKEAGEEVLFPTEEEMAELALVLDECAMAMTQGMIDALVKALQPDPWYVRLWNWIRR